jgi:TolB protein
MSRFDDRLTQELERAATPVEPAEAFDEIDRRHGRRVLLRRVQTAVLATVVFAGSLGGVVVLNRAFNGHGGTGTPAPGTTSPYPITPKANGLLSYADGSRLFTVSRDGGDPQRVIGLPNGTWHPAWSPDGTRIAVSVFAQDREIWIVNADGTDARQLAAAENVSPPSWSPDGTRVAYAADTADGSALHIVNADGTDDHVIGTPLANRDYFSVAFSPDGTKLLYDAGTDSGFGIFVMNVDGSSAIPIGPTNQDYNPSWSPDGSQIVFTRQEEGAESDIWLMSADGTDARPLTNDGPGVTNLDAIFSPDGTAIAYVAGVTGGPGALTIMDTDGRHPAGVVPRDVIGLSWQPVPTAPTETPPASGRDIGLDFNLCRLSSLPGIDFLGDGTNGTAWVGTQLEGGSCPPEFRGERIVAVDVDGDGSAESWAGPLARCEGCSPFAVTDLNGDGVMELVVTLRYAAVTEYTLFSLQPVPRDGPPELHQVTVAEPGSLPSFRATKPVSLLAGGDEGFSSSVRCEGYPGHPIMIVTQTDQPVDAVGPRQVSEVRLTMQGDGTIAVIGSNEYSEAPTAPSHSFTGRACGVDFWPGM